MLTVVVKASDDAQALAQLLTALVRGVAEELVADVIVLDAQGLSAEIAEDAGATLAAGADFAAALALARGRWIAGLPPTAILDRNWIDIVAEHVGHSPPALARLTSIGGGLFSRPAEGWLVPRPLISAVTVEQDLQRLTRRRGVRRLRVLARG